MVTCARCGARSTEEAAFCGACGNALGANAAAKPAPEPPAAGSPDAQPRSTIPEAPASVALHPIPEAPAADPPAEPAAADKPQASPTHLPPGTLIDKKYAVLRVLGEGGMGVVYLARDIHTGLDVVVKAVRNELAHREDVRARTLAEGRALAQIDHPNVVHLRAVAVEGHNLWLVMQYIEGESLDKIIARNVERGEPMPVEEALGVLRQVAAGVGAAHLEGVIHRDLKPANVLIRKKDKVAKVTDFGIALVAADASRQETKGILGSLWYMSPEQVTGRRDLDHRVDVYALGIMLYQMLVGRVPFDARSDYEIMKQQAETPMPAASLARPDVPSVVDELIQRACAKDRDARFQGCEALVSAIDRALGAPQPPAPTIPASTRPVPAPPGPTVITGNTGAPLVTAEEAPAGVPPRRRGRALWIALLVVAVTGGAGAPFAMGLVPGVPGVWKLPRSASSSDAGAPRGSTSASPRADAGAPAKQGLAALVGGWVSNGRQLEAVMAGPELEFRVKRPDQFAPQAYEPGEARFVLHATDDAGVFTVEDRIRPVPPVGKTYDPRSRGTCQEVWTSVGGEPLRARFDGTRLSVDFAKIEPGAANFATEGARVTSCVGLRDLRASKVVSVLTRAP
jgi:eukaryotic-like serine/threonine-protein kinase